MSKIGAVIVTYNPEVNSIENIQRVAKQVGQLIVVDNGTPCFSKSPFKRQIDMVENVSVICNDENYGIAKALNQGCDYLSNNGFDKALLLDQDSIIDESLVEDLNKSMGDKTAMVSPDIKPVNISSDRGFRATYLIPVNSLLFKRMPVESSPLEVLFNITSGSLIKLETWRDVGEFKSELFIDGVDNEFGLRLNSAGYKILISNTASLYQQYGAMEERKLFGRVFYPTNHAAIRHYYMNRNRILIWSQYWSSHPNYLLWDFLAATNMMLKVLLFEKDRLKKIKYSIKGVYDGFFRRTGPYNG